MGLTVVFARLNEITPERQTTAPSSARLADERKVAGNLKSRAGVADRAHHMSAATITPSATGGTFKSSPICLCFPIRATIMTLRYPDLASGRLNDSAEVLE
jgi:hypothetical protein